MRFGVFLLSALISFNVYAAPVEVLIPKGSGVKSIAQKLYAADVIASPLMFEAWLRVTRNTGALHAGRYTFETEDGMRAAISKMVNGDVTLEQMTIPEGLTVAEVMVKLAADERLTGAMPQGIPEGSLLPETYTFSLGTTRKSLITTMQFDMKNVVDEAWATVDELSPLLSREQMVTLASIIEKETALPREYKTVSGVYTNRLKINMKLQADPTVIYGLEDYDGDIRRKDLRNPHPYNTYVHKGLPPTPIANPGRGALMAAASPAKVPYLYFVADGKGGHVFAKTHNEHKKNVKAYLKALRSRAK
ncbi:MAG: endolytic transglycosylase MltG [Alphaproteobacteria bacterium]|nr:endolytic transglycosylase MltG [Alphaproteobacteria bacterium]